MSTHRMQSVLAAAALTALVGIAVPAQAAIYNGHWDPGYGMPFPNLGWTASATFDVPAACLAQADGSYSASGACAGFTLLSAELDFYDYGADPNPSTSPILESFSLTTGAVVTGIDIAGNLLSGISTGYFNPVVPGAASSNIAGGGSYSFSLILFNGFAQLLYSNPVTASPICATRPSPGIECGFSKNAAVGSFTPAVPEPTTTALMMAGLAIMGAVGIRRRGSRAGNSRGV
jgi:PEP-CTERM motif